MNKLPHEKKKQTNNNNNNNNKQNQPPASRDSDRICELYVYATQNTVLLQQNQHFVDNFGTP